MGTTFLSKVESTDDPNRASALSQGPLDSTQNRQEVEMRRAAKDESLYELYLQFMEESRVTILANLVREDSRWLFASFHVPISRSEFSERLDHMTATVRLDYVRCLRNGYAVSRLVEGSALADFLLNHIRGNDATDTKRAA